MTNTERGKQLLEQLINATPTGDLREKLTDINIYLQGAVEHESDSLVCMFSDQLKFQEQLGFKVPVFPDFGRMDQSQIVLMHDILGKNAQAMLMESAELLDWTPWKHWSRKSGNKMVGPEEFGNPMHLKEMRLEIVDTMCFLMNCAMAVGMGPLMLHKIHAEKMQINRDRQKSGVY